MFDIVFHSTLLVASALAALFASDEAQYGEPWAAVVLAIISGVFLVVGLGFFWL